MKSFKALRLLLTMCLLFTVHFAFAQSTEQEQPFLGASMDHHMHSGECLSDAQRADIMAQLAQNRAELQKKGLLPPSNTADFVYLSWPLRQKAGVNDPSYYVIGNFVDEKPGAGIQDYNCGQYTYDGHKGTDIGIYPFGWTKMANNEVEIIAAAAGVIIHKANGNFDQNCSWNGQQWNAVYVQHADGSVAWYGHLKKNSLTSKTVGATVAKGEYLGVVGSSGISTGPHLHFEVYSPTGTLIDPWGGSCNFMNGNSWWNPQHPYWDPKICKIMTHSAPPAQPQCPPESVNASNSFQPGQTVYAAGYFRDFTANSSATYRLYRPNGTIAQTWNPTSSGNSKVFWWWYSYALPSNAPTGTWTFRVTYLNQIVNHNFTVGNTCATPTGLTTTNIATTTARFNWNAVAGALNYTVQLRLANGNWADLNGGPFSSNFVNVSGMTPGTAYEWRVRTNCSGGLISTWSNGVSFTTTGSTCGIPTGLSTTNITQVKASLSWNAVPGATSYTVQFNLGGTWTNLSPVSSNSVNVYGLYANSTYQWRVFAICSSGQSNPSSSTTFNTGSANNCSSGSQYPSTALSPSSSWKYQTLMWGGEYCLVNVQAGQVYTFSYCSSDGAMLNFDGEISVRTTGNQLIMYSDDVCGTQPRLVWQAGFTGQVRVLLTKYSCQNQATNSTMAYRIGGTPLKGDDPDPDSYSAGEMELPMPEHADGIYVYTSIEEENTPVSSIKAEDRDNNTIQKILQPSLQLSPNPTGGLVRISVQSLSETADEETKASILITDLNGKVRFMRQNLSVYNTGIMEQIDVTDLPAGVYFVHVSMGNWVGQAQLVRI